MQKLLCSISLMLCGCLLAMADPVVDNHGQHFATANRKVVVQASQEADQDAICEMLALHGAKIMQGFISSIIYPHVSFKHTSTIHGSANAMSIYVSKRSIKILYTSDAMRERAMDQFRALFDAPYGQRLIRGRNIVEVANIAPKSGLRQNKAGVVDGVSRTLTMAEIQGAIKRAPDGDFVMAIVSKRVFRFNFDVFAGINPTVPHIASQGAYSEQQITEIVKYAAAHQVNFVPAIDLLSANELFETYTGHPMNSVEGMRFVRAMIEQCGRRWGVTRICIGNNEDIADRRYMKFLYDIAANEGIELFMI